MLVAHEASVLDLFSVDLDHLVGVVVEHGGPQSHAVIIARSLGIPMVGQISGLLDQIKAGQLVRIDGTLGHVELDPSPRATRSPRRLLRRCRHQRRSKRGDGGHRQRSPGMPRIEANVNLLSEAARVIDSGARGVGLYRSEMLFLARRTLPTEEEQVEIYRKLIESARRPPRDDPDVRPPARQAGPWLLRSLVVGPGARLAAGARVAAPATAVQGPGARHPPCRGRRAGPALDPPGHADQAARLRHRDGRAGPA